MGSLTQKQITSDLFDEVKRLQRENAALLESKRRDDILTAAMCEIYATIQGRSTQPIEKIVNGCRAELCK